MKTNYLLQPKTKKSNRKVFLVGFFIFTLVFIIQIFAPSFFPGTIANIAKPIWKFKDSLGIESMANKIFSSKEELIQENEKLKNKIDEQNEKAIFYELTFTENEELRKLLNIESRERGSVVPVVSFPVQSPYDLLFVNVPDDDSIVVGGTAVIGSVALGKVIEDLDTLAKVELYSSPNVQTEARLLDGGEPLTLIGKGGGNFSVKVPRDLEISPGELVVLSANPSFSLARVASIETTETDSLKVVRLIIPVNLFSIRFVEILHAI